MPFDNKKCAFQSEGVAHEGLDIITYNEPADAQAAIATAGYFNDIKDLLKLYDLFYAVGTEAVPHLYYVSDLTTDVTLTLII